MDVRLPILDNMTLHSAESAWQSMDPDAFAEESMVNVVDSCVNWPAVFVFPVNKVAHSVFRVPDLRLGLERERLVESTRIDDAEELAPDELAGLVSLLASRLNDGSSRARIAAWHRFLLARMESPDARKDRYRAEPRTVAFEVFWMDHALPTLRREILPVGRTRWRDDDLHLMLTYLARGAARQHALLSSGYSLAYHDHPIRSIPPSLAARSAPIAGADFSWGRLMFRLVRTGAIAGSDVAPIVRRLRDELTRRDAHWYQVDDHDPERIGHVRVEAARAAGVPLDLDPVVSGECANRLMGLWPIIMGAPAWAVGPFLPPAAQVACGGVGTTAAIACWVMGSRVSRMARTRTRGLFETLAFRREFTLPTETGDSRPPHSAGMRGE